MCDNNKGLVIKQSFEVELSSVLEARLECSPWYQGWMHRLCYKHDNTLLNSRIWRNAYSVAFTLYFNAFKIDYKFNLYSTVVFLCD